MVVVFDCFKQVKGTGKSIGIYNFSKNLVWHLAAHYNEIEEWQQDMTRIIVLGNTYNKDDFDIVGVEFVQENKYNPLNKWDCLMWEVFYVTRVCKRLRADKVVFPRGFTPLFSSIKNTVVIHDMIPYYYNVNFPKYFNRLENYYIMKRLKYSARKCGQVVTVSQASKKEIVEITHVNPDKITPILCGLNQIETESMSNGEKPYILAVTSYLPHKNADGIIGSYAAYCKIAEKPLDMIVIGIDEIRKYNLPPEINQKVTCYRYIEKDKDMFQIFKNSTVFLFLSFIEGFGCPPLEAMVLDIPVICSNRSSLPEIAGEAAILVNPTDTEEVASALCRVIQDKSLRDELIRRGKENIKRFSWESRTRLYWDTLMK